MINSKLQPVLRLLLATLLLCTMQGSFASDDIHKLVIQVSSADVSVHKRALNNAVNVQKELGIDNVIIEIVAYGPGLSMLTPESPESIRVPSLAMQNMEFTACGNTMETIEKSTGVPVTLVEGVNVVKAGVVRIMELQEQGYAYVKP